MRTCKKKLSTQLSKIKFMSKGIHPISRKAYGDVHKIWLPLAEEPKPLGEVPELGGQGEPEAGTAQDGDLAQEEQDIEWAMEMWGESAD